MDTERIRQLCGTDDEIVTKHCLKRLGQRGIDIADAEHIMKTGELIEDYPDDYPFPSGLLFGRTEKGEPLHVVCALGDGQLYLITAYRPDLTKFKPDLKTRRKEPDQ